jgi:iron complex transport system ATP-binding protein
LVSKKDSDLAVSVAATAVDPEGKTCSHAESAGEIIEVEQMTGTINIMVVIDGNPTESCLVSTVITATEAKTAALLELDIKSRYSGDLATGTITDAIIVAKTNRGAPIMYGGPASKLGQLVGYCTRKAVKEAIMKANEYL